ncbi:MAG: magnesium transporter [Nitrospira sp.]|nr:magnesium transporter [Nitrospira sp.]MDH5194287.1 magnesium transporter [Nitrospira sp.]
MSFHRKLHETFIIDHPAEAGQLLESFEISEIIRLIESVRPNAIAVLLSSMNPAVAGEILGALPDELGIQVVCETSPGDAAGLLARLGRDRRKAILRRLARPLAKEIRLFMEYPTESVGSLMDAGVFALPEDLTVEEAVTQVRVRAPKDLHDIYVIDRRRHLVGMFSVRDLLLLKPLDRLQSVMRRDVPTIHPMENREEIVDLFAGRRLVTIPVVDLDGRLLGVIKNEDIVKASQEDATADLQTMVGASKDERALSSMWFSVRKRLGWLQVNLVTAFLAATVVGMFESVIAQFTALAVLLPVVAGQSGNTGAQSLAVVMRGLALRDIRPSQWFRVVTKESGVALFNGLAVAATTCTAVYWWSSSAGLTMVIGISMVTSMCIAGLAGAVIPIILKSLNQDPAQSSSIILTTVTDVVGFFSFLGLATVFSHLLV